MGGRFYKWVAIVMLMNLIVIYLQSMAVLSGIHDKAEVVAVAPHVSGDYMVTLGSDNTWAFYDVQKASCVQKVGENTDRCINVDI